VPDVLSGIYRIVWWNTWIGASILTQRVDWPSTGMFLSLPQPNTDDIAEWWERLRPSLEEAMPVYLPVILGGVWSVERKPSDGRRSLWGSQISILS
jgi:hypothetical protein